jgi:hypothetical protein
LRSGWERWRLAGVFIIFWEEIGGTSRRDAGAPRAASGFKNSVQMRPLVRWRRELLRQNRCQLGSASAIS